MDAATLHALILGAVALALCVTVHAVLRKRHAGSQVPTGAESGQAVSTAELSGQLQRLYARKTLLRLGVLAGCALALTVYMLGWHRLWAALPLLAAGLCQYGIHRQKTTTRLMELMRRRADTGLVVSGDQ